MSALVEQLAEKLGIAMRSHGALRLIQLQDCGKFIEACRSDKILILGIEAFRVSGNKIIPNTDLIADYSVLDSEKRYDSYDHAARSAKRYLEQVSTHADHWFDFCLKQLGGASGQ